MRTRIATLMVVVGCLAGVSDLYAQSWLEAYERGTTAAQKREWAVAAEEMAKAIAEKPQEAANARGRRKSVLYVPHFWLGLALIEKGDHAQGQRALRTSESQGVIQKTAHYATLRAALSGVAADLNKDREKQQQAAKAAADKEIGRAMAAQVQATGGGATRTEQFRRASQKMQEGFAARKAADYAGAVKAARAAVQLFGESLVAAKRSTARVPVYAAAATPIPVAPAQRPAAEPVVTPPPAPVAEVAQQSEPVGVPAGVDSARRSTEVAETKSAPEAMPVPTAARESISVEKSDRGRRTAASPAVRPAQLLEQAYVAFARGDLATADTLAGVLIDSTDKRLEGYMLRACARYTRALMTNRVELERAAAVDVRSALAISRYATLDPDHFSPKVIAFFQKQRNPG